MGQVILADFVDSYPDTATHPCSDPVCDQRPSPSANDDFTTSGTSYCMEEHRTRPALCAQAGEF
jgi:hypothetical protein